MRRRQFYEDQESFIEEKEEEEEKKQWNLFKNEPRKQESGSSAESKYIAVGIKWLKLITIVVTFTTVLVSAVTSKATMLLMTSQIKKNLSRPYCNQNIDKRQQFRVTLPEKETAVWIWFLLFSYAVPELGTFIRSLRICWFKTWTYPSTGEFLGLSITELIPAIGSALLIFAVFPEMDVIKAAMLTNAVCFIPGLISFFTRNPKTVNSSMKIIFDIAAIVAQATAFIAWPLVEGNPVLYFIPVAVLMISFGWWENYLSEKSPLAFIRALASRKKDFENKTYFIYAFIAPIKILLFLITALMIIWFREGDVGFLFENFSDTFKSHNLSVHEIEPIFGTKGINYGDAISTGLGTYRTTSSWTPLNVWLINILTSYICYAFSKFTCKIMIQSFSLAFPINLSVPVLLTVLIAMCGNYNKNECMYVDWIPAYLFFNVPTLAFMGDFLTNQYAWMWLLWLLSQTWITLHIWNNPDEKLINTEKLFFRPMYDAFLIDQSIALNRRRTQDRVNKIKELDSGTTIDTNMDTVTRIYACGTMWHENKEEMVEFLKSILRMDEDQCAHRTVRQYLQYNLPSYYEFETHILFDDSFIRKSQDDNDPHINTYVADLIESVSVAAREVHATNVRIKPPIIYPTPYGGKLVWTLPGKTKMVAHLKDAKKIRAKKRWSQVMYMYYLLGYRIMDNDELTPERIKNIAENTYLLALDGDIDFKPQAVHLLVDYMKKNKGLGAACGRIHPVGSGAMAWYQIFEYAVGHWLQKATEHVIGCVLCSPGCFSLFRAMSLMDDNVMAKYTTVSTEARHYVQYDQGEDRWLCTLLLQRGYRVEYSAASDAYTHCPEGFNEFYNQRRRWMPSTTANIMDLLTDYEYIVKVNDNISRPYIFYQAVLMIGTAIGPGTIFLMLIGSFVAAFKLDQWSSFVWNIVPILSFVIVCAICKPKTQLFIAGIISAIYGLVMMAVVLGIMIQIKDDGWLAPSSLFFFCVAGEFIVTAIMHPQEFYCLKYAVIYYVTVPSMYMLLVIYSIFNMNDVSWGTRDVTVVAADNPNDKPQKKEEENLPKKPDSMFSMSYWKGCLDFNGREREMLRNIQASLNMLQQKLDVVERNQYNIEPIEPRKTLKRPTVIEGPKAARASARSSISAAIRKSMLENCVEVDVEDDDSILCPSDDIPDNSWYNDGELVKSQVDYIDKREEKFWEDVIEKYLKPIDDSKKKEKIAKDLKDLRDKMVMTFFMINSLFVLVVFLLTLQKDTIHVDWPIDPKVNYTYNLDQNEFYIQHTYLQLEPIGFVFVIFFAFLMGIQFIAMFYHRFGTYCQIMANTFLEWNLCASDNVQKMTEDQILEKDPVRIFKKLIRLQGVNDDEGDKDLPVTRRNTAHFLALEKDKQSKPAINNLDEAFEIRIKKINSGTASDKDLPVPRKTVAAISQRRSTIQKRASQLGTPRVSQLPPTSFDRTVTFDNPAYEETENI